MIKELQPLILIFGDWNKSFSSFLRALLSVATINPHFRGLKLVSLHKVASADGHELQPLILIFGDWNKTLHR